MRETCEVLGQCRFVDKFGQTSEVTRHGWVRMFCQKKEHSDLCDRQVYQRQKGTYPPDNMAPTGKLLQ